MNKNLKRALMVLLSGGIIAGSAYGMYVISDTTGSVDLGFDFGGIIDSIFGKDKNDDKKPGPTDKVTVDEIELDASGAKTIFAYAEPFSYEGLKVTAKMSDGTKKEVPLADCSFSKPDMTIPGTRRVTVRYQGMSATYDITVNERVMAEISGVSLLDIKGDPTAPYRVEAEAMDLETSEVKNNGGSLRQEAEGVSGGKYLANYGVVGNYLGFTFTAEKEYEGVSIVLHMANPSAEPMNFNGMKIYLNYQGVVDPGELEIKSLTALPATNEDGSMVWENRVLKDITIPAGTNTFTLDILDENVPCIDYIEFYVGTAYRTSNRTDLNVEAGQTVIKEFEDFDLAKIAVREDIKKAHNLPDGVAFVENATTNMEGTSGGRSVGAFVVPTEIATLLCVDQDATVEIVLTAACVGNAYIQELFDFTVDGELMTHVERKNIKDGDPAKSEFWMWKDTSLGYVDLTAGEHEFIAKMVKNGSINADCFKFIIHSYGEFTEHPKYEEEEPPAPVGDIVVIDKVGTYVKEAEALDQSGVVTRQDFVDAGRVPAGEYFVESPSTASGGHSISGFTTGTKFTVKFQSAKDFKLDIIMRAQCGDGPYEISERLKFTLDGVELTVTGDIQGKGWQFDWEGWHDAVLAEGRVLNAGEHTLTLEVLDPTATPGGSYLDLDCFQFNVTEYDGNTEPPAPVYEINISENGTYTKEAEEFSKEFAVTRPDFVPVVGEGSYAVGGGDKGESGGKRIYGFGTGSVFPITIYAEKDCVADIAMAMFGGGGALNGYFELTLDGNKLTVADGNMPGGNTLTSVLLAGGVELSAGAHELRIKLLQHNFDIDCVTFTVTDPAETPDPGPDEPDPPAPTYDLTVSENGEYTIEAEALDNSGVVTRQDFVDAGRVPAGEYFVESPSTASGGHSISGFTTGTVFTMTLKLEKASALTLKMRAVCDQSYEISQNLEFAMNGQVATASGNIQGEAYPTWAGWQTVTLAEGVTLEAGEYTFTMTVKGPHFDLDCFTFTLTDPTATPDPDPEPEPELKPEDCEIQITANGTYVKEAETLDNAGVVTRQDFVNAGRVPAGQYFVESPSTASGGHSISGFTTGTKFTVTIYNEKDATVNFVMRAVCGDGSYPIENNLKFMLDGQKINASGDVHGAGYPSWSGWKDVMLAEGVQLSAGTHIFTMELLGGSGYLDLDSFTFKTTVYDGEEWVEIPESTSEIQIIDNGTYVKEAETFDKTYGITRDDFKKVYGDIKYVVGGGDKGESGGKRIYGFAPGSIYPVTVYAREQCVVDLSIVLMNGGGVVAESFKVTLDGKAVTMANTVMSGSGSMYSSLLATLQLTAGEHTVKIELLKNNFDLDCLTFKASRFGKEFEVTPNIAIAKNGEYRVEAESLDQSKIVLQAGKTTPLETTGMASGGACLAAMVGGTQVELNFYLEEGATVTLSVYMAKYESNYDLRGNVQFFVDGGDAISVTADEGFGRMPDGSNDWYNWKKVTIGTFTLEAGMHTILLDSIGACPNTDYFAIEVSGMSK